MEIQKPEAAKPILTGSTPQKVVGKLASKTPTLEENNTPFGLPNSAFSNRNAQYLTAASYFASYSAFENAQIGIRRCTQTGFIACPSEGAHKQVGEIHFGFPPREYFL